MTVTPDSGGDTQEFVGKSLGASIQELEKRMREAAANLDFEQAARLRDEVRRLEAIDMGLEPPPVATSTAGRAGGGKKPKGPVPLGPGGGGYDPARKKGRGRAR